MKFLKNLNIDSAKALSMAVTALGLLGTILSAQVQENDKKQMKKEIMEELLHEMQGK